jgi:uncharacterized membrane protein
MQLASAGHQRTRLDLPRQAATRFGFEEGATNSVVSHLPMRVWALCGVSHGQAVFAVIVRSMYELMRFLHLAAAVIWLGGMTFMLFALRPAAAALLEPPQRLPLMARTMQRFFVLVAISVVVLLITGFYMLGQAAKTVGMAQVPIGWHIMLTLGLVMALVFAWLYLVPFRKLQSAVASSDWAQAGQHLKHVAMLVHINFGLGWLAVAALRLLR